MEQFVLLSPGSPVDGVSWGSPATLTVSGNLKLTPNNSTSTFATLKMGANTLEILGSPGNMLWIQTYGVDFITRKGGNFTAYEAADINFVSMSHNGTDGVLAADGTSGLSFQADYHAFNGEIRAAASTTSQSSLNIPEGTAPSAPNDGDIWVTTTDIVARINGVSESLISGGGVPTTITVADESADTTCFVSFFTAATGDLGPKTGTNLTFNSNTGLLTATNFSGGGASLTSLTAANISSGNLGSGVLPYSTVSATSSAFKVPFLNTTGGTSGNRGLLLDTDGFTYNPSTNTFTVSTISTSGQITAGTQFVDAGLTDNDVLVAGTGGVIEDSAGALTFNGSTLGVSADIECTLQIQATNGLIGTYDDAASASWGGPIWGMDDGFTGPTGGTNALATSCYGMRWNRASSTQANANIGEGVYVYQNGVIEGGIGTAGIYSVGPFTGTQLRSTGTLSLLTNTSENAVVCTTNAQVSLYHNAGLEFRTQQHELAGNTAGAELYDHSGTLRDAGFNDLRLVK
jgi:hypothetical protein